jgi:hypothetical protein
VWSGSICGRVPEISISNISCAHTPSPSCLSPQVRRSHEAVVCRSPSSTRQDTPNVGDMGTQWGGQRSWDTTNEIDGSRSSRYIMQNQPRWQSDSASKAAGSRKQVARGSIL